MSIEKTFSELKQIEHNGKLAGSWIVSGPYGVGKSTLLHRFCGWLLTGEDTEISFHPDLKWVERDYTEEEKKDIVKTLNAGKLLDEEVEKNRSRKTQIVIDDIRKAISFLSMTASSNKWRVLVIDSADEMNEEAANALLKLLEEPPARAVIFLTSHNLGKLLDTIRSRCRILKVEPQTPVEMKSWIMKNYPNIENFDVLLQLSYGSIGKLKEIIDFNASDIYREMLEIIEQKFSADAVFSFCERHTKDDKVYQLVKDLWLFYLLSLSKNPDLTKKELDFYFDLWDESNQAFKEVEGLYLDRKSVLANLFFKLGKLKC